MVTDPIADLLTRVRNACLAGHQEVVVPSSKLKRAVAEVLKNDHFVEDYRLEDNQLVIVLKYDQGEPAIRSLRRISKPSLRVYRTVDKLPWVKNGFGVAIISTSQGVMSDFEARKKNLGGEILCEVW